MCDSRIACATKPQRLPVVTRRKSTPTTATATATLIYENGNGLMPPPSDSAPKASACAESPQRLSMSRRKSASGAATAVSCGNPPTIGNGLLPTEREVAVQRDFENASAFSSSPSDIRLDREAPDRDASDDDENEDDRIEVPIFHRLHSSDSTSTSSSSSSSSCTSPVLRPSGNVQSDNEEEEVEEEEEEEAEREDEFEVPTANTENLPYIEMKLPTNPLEVNDDAMSNNADDSNLLPSSILDVCLSAIEGLVSLAPVWWLYKDSGHWHTGKVLLLCDSDEALLDYLFILQFADLSRELRECVRATAAAHDERMTENLDNRQWSYRQLLNKVVVARSLSIKSKEDERELADHRAVMEKGILQFVLSTFDCMRSRDEDTFRSMFVLSNQPVWTPEVAMLSAAISLRKLTCLVNSVCRSASARMPQGVYSFSQSCGDRTLLDPHGLLGATDNRSPLSRSSRPAYASMIRDAETGTAFLLPMKDAPVQPPGSRDRHLAGSPRLRADDSPPTNVQFSDPPKSPTTAHWRQGTAGAAAQPDAQLPYIGAAERVFGVSFDRSKRNWEASWADSRTGKRVKKCFSEGRWGSQARAKAVAARKEAEQLGLVSTGMRSALPSCHCPQQEQRSLLPTNLIAAGGGASHSSDGGLYANARAIRGAAGNG